ncbi:OmpH family outer membrane protein [bacterium]|nr:OmpH family outer membrane protein [bacterium]
MQLIKGLSLTVLFSSLPLMAANVKVGMVDLQKALQETKAGKAAKASLEKEITSRRTKVEKKRNAFEKLQQEYQKKSLVLSGDARQKKEGELQEMAMEIQKMMQEYDVEMRQKEVTATKPIIEGLRDLLPAISKEKKVDLVVEKNAGVLYAVDTTDLTDELIKAYDKKSK